MAKDEAAGPGGAVAAAAVAAVEKHFAMHGIYAIPPSAGAMPPSPQTQRPIKHSGSREEAAQEEQDYLSTPHSKYASFLLLSPPSTWPMPSIPRCKELTLSFEHRN